VETILWPPSSQFRHSKPNEVLTPKKAKSVRLPTVASGVDVVLCLRDKKAKPPTKIDGMAEKTKKNSICKTKIPD